MQGKGEDSDEKQPEKRILFLCTHNSSRSQTAEGLLRSLRGNIYEVFSAGTDPSSVHPAAIAVMAEIGIDIRDQYAKGVSSLRLSQDAFDEVVPVCAMLWKRVLSSRDWGKHAINVLKIRQQ